MATYPPKVTDPSSPRAAWRTVSPRRERGRVRRSLRRLAELLVELVGETVLAVLACALLALVGGSLAWGWNHAPRSTMALGCAVSAVVTYGGWQALRGGWGAHGSRGLWTSLAVAVFAAVAFWLLYVVTYCSCMT